MHHVQQMQEQLACLRRERDLYFRLLDKELEDRPVSLDIASSPARLKLIARLQEKIGSADKRLARAEARLANYYLHRLKLEDRVAAITAPA